MALKWQASGYGKANGHDLNNLFQKANKEDRHFYAPPFAYPIQIFNKVQRQENPIPVIMDFDLFLF